jgi:type IV pilus assembly protein PilX
MKSISLPRLKRAHSKKQRGVVLFFALIALVVMSLAAVALVRSVDTNSMIAGNLAFKQSVTNSGDAGVEAAVTFLASLQAADPDLDPMTEGDHPFNTTDAGNGYYSNIADDPLATDYLNLFDDAAWQAITRPPITDSAGNTIEFIIQRVCRIGTAGVAGKDSECLSSGEAANTGGRQIVGSTGACDTCNKVGLPSQLRITVRTTGFKNTRSYLQAFVF